MLESTTAARVLSAQADERRQIVRELHNGAEQYLTALKMKLEIIHVDLAHTPGGGPLRADLETAIQLTDQASEALRALAQDLRPPDFATVSLDVALDDYSSVFGKRTGLAITITGAEPELDELTALALYRVAQETLAGIVTRAAATPSRETAIALHHAGENVILMITDNNPSTDTANVPFTTRPAWNRLQECLKALGGGLTVNVNSEQGIRLTAVLPRRQNQ